MVKKDGVENGIGIYDIPNHSRIETTIKQRINSFNYDFELNSIYVMGSYGTGMGIPSESDLDIIVSGVFYGVYSPNELSKIQGELSQYITDGNIIQNFPEFTEIDLYVHDPTYAKEVLHSYAKSESQVTHYYNLTNKEKIKYEDD